MHLIIATIDSIIIRDNVKGTSLIRATCVRNVSRRVSYKLRDDGYAEEDRRSLRSNNAFTVPISARHQ